MNTIEQILGSVAAVSTTGYPKKISTSLLPMPKYVDNFKVSSSLGAL